jgi:hypothetical protein
MRWAFLFMATALVGCTASNAGTGKTAKPDYHSESEAREQAYIREHHCKFVRHWSVEEAMKYADRVVIDGKEELLDEGLKRPYSEYDCNGATAYVDDVNGKPWKP